MSDLVNRLRLGDTRLSRATLNEVADHIEALEAALREIVIYNDNITKTLREALAPQREYDPDVAPCDDAEFGMKP